MVKAYTLWLVLSVSLSKLTDEWPWGWVLLCALGLRQHLAQKWMFRKYLWDERVSSLQGSYGFTCAYYMSDLR